MAIAFLFAWLISPNPFYFYNKPVFLVLTVIEPFVKRRCFARKLSLVRRKAKQFFIAPLCMKACSFLIASVLLLPQAAISAPVYPEVPASKPKPTYCWMTIYSQNRTLDLSSLCIGKTPALVNYPIMYTNIGGNHPFVVEGSSAGVGGSGGGNCNVESDRAADGSRCGGRAASRRRGGR